MDQESTMMVESISGESVPRALGIYDNPALNIVEKRRFARQVEHLQIVQMQDDTVRLSDVEDQRRLYNFCHEMESGQLVDFEVVARKLATQPFRTRRGVFAPLGEMWDAVFNRTQQITNRSIRQRNVVENVTNTYRRDHCGQRALVAALMAKLFYPNIEAYILPYTRDPTKPLSSSRHYMIMWRNIAKDSFSYEVYGNDFGDPRTVLFKPHKERDVRRRVKTPLEHLLKNAEKIARSVQE